MTSEEEKNQNIDDILEKVANLLDEASLSQKDSVRLTNLKHVQELILRKNAELLDNFLDEVLQFQLDKSGEVKKFVVSFIEEACKKDPEIIFKVIDNFRFLLFDDNINVQKRAYLAMIVIFKSTIKWISKRKKELDEEQQQTWLGLLDIKNHIASQLDSENDGVRTTAIKFLEMLIILFTPRIKESLVPSINEQDFSIDQIGYDCVVLDKAALLEDGRHHFRKLLEYTLSTHISSVNLISSICVLSNVAKQRPEYMEIVFDTYGKILGNMPPTLGKSQVSSVRKQMKMLIASICKNHCCVEFQPQITSLLVDLGASNSEIGKIIPKVSSEFRKRALSSNETSSNLFKKPKLQQQTSTSRGKDDPPQASTATSSDPPTVVKPDAERSLETVLDDLVVKLNTKENVTDLVMVTMAFLPEQMPQIFQNSYKPIANAGTNVQIRNLARMLAFHLNEAGLLKFSQQATTSANVPPTSAAQITVSEPQANTTAESKLIVTIDDLDNDDDDNDDSEMLSGEKAKLNIASIKAEKMDHFDHESTSPVPKLQSQTSISSPMAKKLPQNLEQIVNKKTTNKTFKLNEVTVDQSSKFNSNILENLLNLSYDRILKSDETVSKCKEASLVRKKVLVETTSLADYDLRLTNYIFEEPRKRIDIGLIWIYSIYMKLKQAQLRRDAMESGKLENMDGEIIELQVEENKIKRESDLKRREDKLLNDIKNFEYEYDSVSYKILHNLLQRPEQKDLLFSKVICQIPFLSESCLSLLKTACQEHENQSFFFTMNTLSDLIVTRFAQRHELLQILLELTHTHNPSIRENAIVIALNLYERDEFHKLIQDFAYDRLKYLTLPNPPMELVGGETMDVDNLKDHQWNEELIKSCLYLFLELMSINHSIINSLSQVYIESSPEVKRVILKMLESPIKKMGMDSSELLKFFEEFPQGSETLILRIIHILTEKSTPTLELINKVRDMYATKLLDVRFLIPILTSLTKAEVLAALPQLIKLSQPVVKEVFNRLLGINVNQAIHKSPVTPAELLVALHQIDPVVCDLKSIISATSLCFAEKQIYTQEILAAVIKQLIDVNPIPTLYMRTVIQSLTIYPKLSSFVVIMMQRLIGKQIWKYPKVWEGFIKCCQRIKAISHQILIQLPAAQLREVFTAAPDLKEHLCQHVQSLQAAQKTSINKETLDLIEQTILTLPAQAPTLPAST